MLVSFTFYYALALSITVLSIITVSVFLSLNADKYFNESFLLSTSGEIWFKSDKTSYQLVANSRLSFIGCWLVMIPKQSIATAANYMAITQLPLIQLSPRELSPKAVKQLGQGKSLQGLQSKQVFIFRDSINNKDFSRLANVIKKLA